MRARVCADLRLDAPCVERVDDGAVGVGLLVVVLVHPLVEDGHLGTGQPGEECRRRGAGGGSEGLAFRMGT